MLAGGILNPNQSFTCLLVYKKPQVSKKTNGYFTNTRLLKASIALLPAAVLSGCSITDLPKDCKQVAVRVLEQTAKDAADQSYFIKSIPNVIAFNPIPQGRYSYGKKFYDGYDLMVEPNGQAVGVMKFKECLDPNGCSSYQFSSFKNGKPNVEIDNSLKYLQRPDWASNTPSLATDDTIQCKFYGETSTGQRDNFMITFGKFKGYKVEPLNPARLEFTLEPQLSW